MSEATSVLPLIHSFIIELIGDASVCVRACVHWCSVGVYVGEASGTLVSGCHQ